MVPMVLMMTAVVLLACAAFDNGDNHGLTMTCDGANEVGCGVSAKTIGASGDDGAVSRVAVSNAFMLVVAVLVVVGGGDGWCTQKLMISFSKLLNIATHSFEL